MCVTNPMQTYNVCTVSFIMGTGPKKAVLQPYIILTPSWKILGKGKFGGGEGACFNTTMYVVDLRGPRWDAGLPWRHYGREMELQDVGNFLSNPLDFLQRWHNEWVSLGQTFELPMLAGLGLVFHFRDSNLIREVGTACVWLNRMLSSVNQRAKPYTHRG